MFILRFPDGQIKNVSSTTRPVTIRLSIEAPDGKRRRISVSFRADWTDDDNSLMVKASAEFRRQHGFADRVVAIYVTHPTGPAA